jgi:glycosyltransferase involved in cell wall biosynthesis
LATRRIGINALHINWGVNAGTETYLTNIIRPWYDNPREGYAFVLFCCRKPDWWRGERPHFRLHIAPLGRSLPGRFLCEQILFPFTQYASLDLLFSPGYVASRLARTRQIVTIHDAFAWVVPEEISAAKRLYWRTMIPASARRSDRVLADTHVTAADIAKYCRIDPQKISVVHLGGAHLQSVVPETSVLQRHGLLPREYFHCVGIFKEIKNPWRVLQAYSRYRASFRSQTPKALVMVGHVGGDRGDEVLAAAKRQPGVVLPGRLDDAELAAVYRNSAGLIFPSLYEGFGIPILEAQSLDCPVITSNISCMPEVAGRGALLVNPLDVDDILGAMLQLDAGPKDGLLESGTENLARFSWETASSRTLEIIGATILREGLA